MTDIREIQLYNSLIKEMPLKIASLWLVLVFHVGWHQWSIKENHSLFQVFSLLDEGDVTYVGFLSDLSSFLW